MKVFYKANLLMYSLCSIKSAILIFLGQIIGGAKRL
jgi:hypothetical protein